MAEKRTSQVYTNIEPSINALLTKALIQSDMSASTYLRKLIIDDLVAKSLLATDELLTIVN